MSAEKNPMSAASEKKQEEIYPTKLVVTGGRIPSRSERLPELPLDSYAQGRYLRISATWKFELVLDAQNRHSKLIYLENESHREYATTDGEYLILARKSRQVLREIPVEWRIDAMCEKTVEIRVDSDQEHSFWMRILVPADQYWARVCGAK